MFRSANAECDALVFRSCGRSRVLVAWGTRSCGRTVLDSSEDGATSWSVSRLGAGKQLVLARDATEEEDNDLGRPLPVLDQPSILHLLETVLRVVDPDDQAACTWLCPSSAFTCPDGNAARSRRPELMREAGYIRVSLWGRSISKPLTPVKNKLQHTVVCYKYFYNILCLT